MVLSQDVLFVIVLAGALVSMCARRQPVVWSKQVV
jgi:hypothetical protein